MTHDLRKYPRVAIPSSAILMMEGIDKEVSLLNISPIGVQLECNGEAIEALDSRKLGSGLYPRLQVQFDLPVMAKEVKKVIINCEVLYCRRFRQDGYQMGLQFFELSQTHKDDIANFMESFHEATI